MEQAEQLIKGIRKGLLQWYDFKQESTVLFTGEITEPLAEMLAEKNLEVICASCGQMYRGDWQRTYESKFDYIISVESLERELYPEQILRIWRNVLKPEGILLLGMNNRFGIRYFCGDRDPYTERNFDGIEGYRRAYSKRMDRFRGRCFHEAELKKMLADTGWESFCFYSVLSDLDNPSLICREDYLPKEDLANRLFPMYHYPDTVFLEEESLYASLEENDMFHKMANAYLIECSGSGEGSDACYVVSSMERGKGDAFFTIIRKSGVVEKRAAYPEGQERLEKLAEHMQDLAAHGISVVETKIKDGVCVMPYMDYEVGQVYLKRLLQTDREKFLEEMDAFRDLILHSSENVSSDEKKEVVLRRGYPDMVPLNSFYHKGTFVFYDQEFCKENYPADAIVTRVINTFYAGNRELEKILPPDLLFERYGLTEKKDGWSRLEGDFLSKLRKEKELQVYHEIHRRNYEVINSNRQRINYPINEYERLFVNIFPESDQEKLILFGSGNFTKKFLALYRQDYPVFAIVDNNPDRWGEEIDGIPVQSPEIIKGVKDGACKVIICIKDYMSVMKQLDDMGISGYSIFDWNKSYPRKRRPVIQIQGEAEKEKSVSKKYRTGYIAGVFDLFHIGHLNMFKRAKEQCDYLIVGVVSDEGVRKNKGVEPFVPFEERIEMVRSCRYVDEAVEIPFGYGGTKDAYRLYQFDCQFSGSDYTDNPDWLANKTFLEMHGSDLVFFPYTESTSSTKLKALIEKKIL